MRRTLHLVLIFTVVLTAVKRLPAPILEEAATPTPQPKQSTPPTKQKSIAPSESSSARQFDGVWQGTRVEKNLGATYSEKFTLTVRGKSAELSAETTSTLSNPQGWSYLPEQYRHLSPLHLKVTNQADHVVADGGDLIIRWQGGQLVDWAPKALPREEAEKLAAPQTSNKPNVFTLKGNELVAAGGTIYHRAK